MTRNLVRYLPLSLFALVAVFGAVQPAFAQSVNDYNGLQLQLALGGDNAFLRVLTGIINFILLAGGIIAFLFVLYGGFTYLTAGGDAAAAGKGRTMIVNAIIGVIIIFLSYSLVRFVVSRVGDTGNQNDTNFDTVNDQDRS
jgi:hypothetical protein